MKVLSLFDGISCLRVALGNRDVQYYASEIDPNAIKISKKNYPSIQHIGAVQEVSGSDYLNVDLMVGGSPCVDLSVAKQDRKGLEGDHSKLFWEFVRIWKEAKPKWFVLENVASMPKKDKDLITATLGVVPIQIDASLVSAQSRKRLFWTNIPNVEQPTDRCITIQSVLEPNIPAEEKWCGVSIRGRKDASGNWVNQKEWRGDGKASALTSTCSSKLALIGRLLNRRLDKDGKRHDGDHEYAQQKVFEPRTDSKCGTLTKYTKDNMVLDNASIRKLTPIECERLMGLPDNYTDGVARSARYRAVGNAFHIEVIKHILSFIPCKHGIAERSCAFCRAWGVR